MANFVTRIAVTVGIGLSPGLSEAACTQPQLGGSWRAYIFGGDLGWFTCPFRISDIGDITDAQCIDDEGAPHPLTEGSIKLKSANTCLFTSKMKVDSFEVRIFFATLALDKRTASGVGKSQDGTKLAFDM